MSRLTGASRKKPLRTVVEYRWNSDQTSRHTHHPSIAGTPSITSFFYRSTGKHCPTYVLTGNPTKQINRKSTKTSLQEREAGVSSDLNKMSEIRNGCSRHDEVMTEWMMRHPESQQIILTVGKHSTVFVSNMPIEETSSCTPRQQDWHRSSSPSRASRSMIQNEEIARDDISSLIVKSSRHKLQTHKDDKMITNIYDDDTSTKKIHDGRKWTVGKVSFMMLILVSLTDVILSLVDAQMESLESPDHYDALSADVIRPAFRYHVSSSDRTTRRNRMGLGSAAITSVTNALSPILPFTGGLDLRREDYWKNGLLGSVASIAEQIKSAFSESPASPLSTELLKTRGGSKVARKTPRSTSRETHATILSNSEPFMALNDIARLTLKDVSLAFRYAVESTRVDFNPQKFFTIASLRVKDAFTQMSEAAASSRGKGIGAALTGANLVAGDVDALLFCAAMRIFAEWRVLRQVPEGYKGYAVGMSLGQKDIVQNVGKIEKAVHEWIEYQGEASSIDECDDSPRSSPTLRELLQFEANIGLHDKLPRLKEKTAAMGLLWVRRQLHYQTALFANVIQVPGRFDTARAAISAAYEEVYNSYHGWAVQKIFTYSFQAAPDTSEVYKVMNPERLKEVTESAQSRGSAMSLDQPSHQSDGANILEKVSRHVGQEWEKLASSIGGLFRNRSPVTKLELDHAKLGGQRDISTEAFINEQMKLDAHEHIVTYLEVAKPILDDLARLFDEFNMDDPTKV